MKTHAIAASICRWAARITGTLVAVMLLVFAIEEGVDREFAVQASFWGLVLVGIGNVLGWRFELAGGIMALASVFLVAVSILMVQGLFIPVFYIVLALPGILYLTSARIRRSNPLDYPDKGVKKQEAKQ